MKKIKIHKRLTKIIHPNRNFIWAVVLLFISGLVLSSYIYITSSNDSSYLIDLLPMHRKVFSDPTLKYSVSYPQHWQLEKDRNGSTIFENPSNPAESITVVKGDSSIEKAIRRSVTISKETLVNINNEKIDFINITNNAGNPDLNLAIIKTAQSIYYISGRSAYFQAFVYSFKFLQ